MNKLSIQATLVALSGGEHPAWGLKGPDLRKRVKGATVKVAVVAPNRSGHKYANEPDSLASKWVDDDPLTSGTSMFHTKEFRKS